MGCGASTAQGAPGPGQPPKEKGAAQSSREIIQAQKIAENLICSACDPADELTKSRMIYSTDTQLQPILLRPPGADAPAARPSSA